MTPFGNSLECINNCVNQFGSLHPGVIHLSLNLTQKMNLMMI